MKQNKSNSGAPLLLFLLSAGLSCAAVAALGYWRQKRAQAGAQAPTQEQAPAHAGDQAPTQTRDQAPATDSGHSPAQTSTSAIAQTQALFPPSDPAKAPGASSCGPTEQTSPDLWTRLKAETGTVFYTVTGLPFRFAFTEDDERIQPIRLTEEGEHPIPHTIPRKDFETAAALLPVSGPGELKKVHGASYVYAILMRRTAQSL